MQTRTSRPTSSDDGPQRVVGLEMKNGRGRRTLPTAAVGDEELQVKLVLRDVGSNDAVHRLTGTPELWGLPASPNTVQIGASHSLLLPWVCSEPRQPGGHDSHAPRTMHSADR